ncbi:MAG: GNAT family N-acetyltransferase, partial [Acidimicrobiia bacterium]|nr:GNAT family N-acetyltransferase [Acidimicrobiia bacterium]
LLPPHDLDELRLAALDTELRQDVPGTDGWETTIEMWRAEIESPEYDPNGYLIAVDEVTGAYCGLIRFWRNADQPRLGLLAVTRPHRGSLLATALLRAGLEGASDWGSQTFSTSTSPSNPGTYPALLRLGVRPIDRRYQMVLTTDYRPPISDT